MPSMFIMRGLPGSGKTHLAYQLVDADRVASADRFFVTENGDYDFDASRLPDAHLQCRIHAAQMAFDSSGRDIAIDNTNIWHEHYTVYERMASEAGYDVEIVYPQTPWAWSAIDCAKRTMHRVPVEVIERMQMQFEHVAARAA